MLQIKYGRDDIIRITEDCENVKDLKVLLSYKTNTRVDTIKLILGKNVLRDDYMIFDLHKGVIHVGESVLKVDADSVITMIGCKSSDILSPPKVYEQTRVVNDLSTDLIQPEVHPAQMTKQPPQQRTKSKYEFQSIETLKGLPNEEKAHQILHSLANDPAILNVMKKHKWSVGTLAELYPEGLVGVDDICILGLNTNKGQKIELRLRTDDLQGFRKILSIKKTLYHELAHNEQSPHDAKFYTLLRQIEEEIVTLDWRASKGKTLTDVTTERSYVSTSIISSTQPTSVYRLDIDANSNHRLFPAAHMAGNAALLRLSDEELETEKGCGCKDENEANRVVAPMELCQACPQQAIPTLSAPLTQPVSQISSSHSEAYAVPLSLDAAVVLTDVSTALDASLSLSLCTSSSPPERLFMLREALMQIVNGYNGIFSNDILASMRLIRQIVGNAKDLPDEKYRSVRNNSLKFESLVNRIDGAKDFLISAGFESTGDRFVLKYYDVGLLYIAYSFVDMCINIVDSLTPIV